MEVYLYKCEVCGSCIFSNQDHGRTWYNNCCGACKIWTYYEKVVVREITRIVDSSKWLVECKMEFYAPTAEEYKKDGNSNTRTN
mgnify:CR=1 FL=1